MADNGGIKGLGQRIVVGPDHAGAGMPLSGQQMAPPVPGTEHLLLGGHDALPPPPLQGPVCGVAPGSSSAALILLATAAGEDALPAADSTPRRCTFHECPAPAGGDRFVKIDRGNKAGNQDWSSLADQVLCGPCYDRFKSTGSLELGHLGGTSSSSSSRLTGIEGGIKDNHHMGGISMNHNPSMPTVVQGHVVGGEAGMGVAVDPANAGLQKKCTYVHCDNPGNGTRYIRVDKNSKAGGRDWSPLDGSVLCRACYNRFRDRGTLERSTPFREPLPPNERECSYQECDNPKKGKKFIKIQHGYEAGSRDWTPLANQVLCKVCYDRYFKRGTLERSASRVSKDGGGPKRIPLTDAPRAGSPPRPRPPGLNVGSGSKDVVTVEEGAKTCTYEGCTNPSTSSRFVKIEEGCKAGGRDWTCLAGSILCHSCYNRFSYSGTLERSRKRTLDDGARKCTFDKCPNPQRSSQYHQINEGCKAGNRDWSSVYGFVLCNACYSQFRHRGTLERSVAAKEPLAQSTRKCTYDDCDNPTSSTRFIQIDEGCQAGGRDWSSLTGHVLCHTCYGRFRDRGTLVRSRACRSKPLDSGNRKCTYQDCLKPTQSSNFYLIDEGSRAGGRDWSPLAGQVLCDACYNQFRKRGSLVRCAAPGELGCKAPLSPSAGSKRKEAEGGVEVDDIKGAKNEGGPAKKRAFEDGDAVGDLGEAFADEHGHGGVSASAVVPDK